tara:strand:- start:6873 stop:7109 length:237 start_codon:yes stop_codon:yes gene_type:complete
MTTSKFTRIINQYMQIAQLGREIIAYKKTDVNKIPAHLLDKNNTLQYERILRFNELVSKNDKDRKKYRNAIDEFWTGY